MATTVSCDRCKTVQCQVVPVLGRDLCNSCVADFREWADSGLPAPNKPKAHDWWRRIEKGLERHARLTPDALLDMFPGVTRRNAHDALRFYKAKGWLRQVGTSTFAMAPEDQEARSNP